MHRKIIPYMGHVEKLLAGEFVPPVSCEIDPSNRCQNECNFCIYRDYRKAQPVDLDFSVYLDLLANLRRMGARSISFTGGGEPTVHPRFGDMIRAADGFEIGLVTNGVDLDEYFGLIDRFRFIRVSLDAASDTTYRKIKGTQNFGKVVKNIRRLLSHRKQTTVGISYVVTKDNQHEISEAQGLAKDLEADYIEIRSTCETYNVPFPVKGNGRSFILKRYRSSGCLPCVIAGLVGIVCANGDVSFCCQGRGKEDFKLGNLKTDRFRDVWKRRMERQPDCDVQTCRYMNYAKGYELYSRKKHAILRHYNFL